MEGVRSARFLITSCVRSCLLIREDLFERNIKRGVDERWIAEEEKRWRLELSKFSFFLPFFIIVVLTLALPAIWNASILIGLGRKE